MKKSFRRKSNSELTLKNKNNLNVILQEYKII